MAEKSPSSITDHLSRTVGREAQRNNILAARLVADIVKTTLGPKGMDKMLVDSAGNITVTNDGVTILQEMEFDHPAAKMIVEIAKTQEREVGDGTTTVALLAGKLLEHAETLLDKRIHPTSIIKGFEQAAEYIRSILPSLGMNAQSREILKRIAMTSMTGKGAEKNREHFANIIVNAVDLIASGKHIDQSDIRIVKILGDRVESSELIQGLVIDKEVAHDAMPRQIRQAKIALLDFPIELRTPEVEAKISISTPDQLEQFLMREEASLKQLTERIIASGASVVFCQKGIDDVAQYYFARSGVYAVRRLPKSDIEKLARATGAMIIANSRDLGAGALGYAGLVEERILNRESFTFIQECKNPKSVSILIRGSTPHLVDEIERALTDGIGVVSSAVRDQTVLAGGGAIEMELARKVRLFSRTHSGKEQLAIEEFASALESIPEALAENAGLDPIDSLVELRKRHESGFAHDGLNLLSGKIENCSESGILEPLRVKLQAINSATEVACMILRIDDVLIASDKKENSKMNYSGFD